MINLLHEIKEYGVQQGLPILRDSEIPLLQRILRRTKPKRVLEIGTCIGYSTLLTEQCLDDDSVVTTV